MGISSSDIRDFPTSPAPQDSIFVSPVPRRRRRAIRWHLILFLLTVATTILVGAEHFASFSIDFGSRDLDASGPWFLLNGLWYSGSILAILGAHEFGHYFACRLYGVDASLPYFLPAPLPLTGTLGAFIRIRQPIASKRELFDIGIAGPIAGFIVAVPVLLVGLLIAFGPRHPRTIDEDIPLDRARLRLAAVALVMFILCFTPAPIEVFGLGAQP